MGNVRVALVAESFLPHTNGVTHSLLRVIDHLLDHGHQAMVMTPQARRGDGDHHPTYREVPVTPVPAIGWPGYRDVRVCTAGPARIGRTLASWSPDIVHLASPFMLGWAALKATQPLGLPTVAVYQTDVPSYAARYRAPWGEELLWRRVLDIHGRADRTLAPSSHAQHQLEQRGVPRVHRWGRGVDITRFHPARRSTALRAAWAPGHHTVIGYVGRLAPEKQVEDLAALANIPNTTLVIVGTGPSEPQLRRLLPHAVFTGFLDGDDLAEAMASFDVFVHCGQLETFCQTIQEAHASSVPVVAPRRGGPVDLIEDGLNGMLYAPGDAAQLRAAVTHAVTHPQWRARAGNHGRVAVQGRTWTAVCDQLVEHYRDVIETRARTPLVEVAS